MIPHSRSLSALQKIFNEILEFLCTKIFLLGNINLVNFITHKEE